MKPFITVIHKTSKDSPHVQHHLVLVYNAIPTSTKSEFPETLVNCFP